MTPAKYCIIRVYQTALLLTKLSLTGCPREQEFEAQGIINL